MGNQDILPDYSTPSFTCPHCGSLSLMNYNTNFYNRSNLCTINTATSTINIATCINCNKHIIWIDDKYVYPDIIVEEANPDMPESVKKLYDEAGLIYSKSPRAACALLRLAVDKLCNELGEQDRDINKNIGELVKKGLSKSVQQALDTVRVVGNKAVHPGQIDYDVDDVNTAKMLMQLLNIIVERMISEEKKIESCYQALPESAKNAIKLRDNK